MPEEEFELYLSLLSRFLRLKAGQREEIATELRDHLEERLSDLMEQGVTREAAIQAAIDEFGGAAALAQHFTLAAQIRKRRMIMRFTLGGVAALAVGFLVVTAFWPETHNPPAPAVATAGPQPKVVAAGASEPAADAPKRKRGVLYMDHVAADSVSGILQRVFGKESGVQFDSEATSNTLVFSSPPDLYEEIRRVVAGIDRPAIPVAIEVTILEILAPANDPARLPSLSTSRFSGPTETVEANIAQTIQELQKSSLKYRLKKLSLKTNNNKTASLTDELGKADRTTVECIPRVSDLKLTTLDHAIQDRSIWFEKGIEGGDEVTNRCSGTISIPDGETAVAGISERVSGTKVLFLISVSVDRKPRVASNPAAK